MAKVRLVRDQLVQHARVAVIGESPGKEEVLSGAPFVGPSGALLNKFLFTAGLRRSDVAVLNVSQRRPAFNSDDIKLIPKDELEIWMADLRRRLTTLPEVQLIVPLGNTALEAVLGSEKIALTRNKKLTITKAAGFYFDNVSLDNGRKVLVIPCYHPAATFRATNLTKVCEEIWLKIGEELRRGLLADTNALGPLLDDTFKIEAMPHPDDALEFAHKLIREGRPISFDIETPRDVPREKILCVGFTNDGVHGMTIPYDDHRAVGPKDWREKYQEAVRLIVESDVPKIGQNVLFDCYMLEYLKGVKVRNVTYDTRTMHLVWDARRDHDLGSIVSGFFRARTWKDREEDSRVTDDYVELADYCARDSLVTWHAAMRLEQLLERESLLTVYKDIYGRRFYPLLRIMLHGTLVNQKARQELYDQLDTECRDIRRQLADLAEVSLAGDEDKSLSDKKIGAFLYGMKNPPPRPTKFTKTGQVAKNQPKPLPNGLELKPILDKDTGKPTTNEVALRTLRLRVEGKNKKASHAIDLILRHREKHQLSTFAQEGRIDKDNRFRCSFGFAETARLTSSSNPVGTGGNSQNVARPARHMFLPDPGCIFVQVDMCLDGDTLLDGPFGQKAIRDARAGDWVYTLRGTKPAVGQITKQKCTGVKPVLKITLDNGETVIASTQHRFLVVRKWRAITAQPELDILTAEQLVVGDRLPALRKRVMQEREILYCRSPLEYIHTHRLVAEAAFGEIPAGFDVHHRNGDKLDNNINNLELVEAATHRGAHGKLTLKQVREDIRLAALRIAKAATRGTYPAHLKKHEHARVAGLRCAGLRKRKRVVRKCEFCAGEFESKISAERKYCKRNCYMQARREGLNHKIVSIEPLGEREVYTITVEPDHNYALACGVFTLNSQIEDRIIKCYSKDSRLIELARRKPWDYDAHTDLARKIYGLSLEEQPTGEQRDLGKRTRHGAQRDLKGQRFADELLKSGVVRTKAWCDDMLEAYHRAEPGIREGYFEYIKELVMKNEELVTPWGYRVLFRSERKDADMLREAYSTLPQAGAVLTVDLQGLCPLDELIQEEVLQTTRLNNEVHDSVIASCPLDEAYYVAKFLVTSLEQPVNYDGVELSCPASVKISATLGKEGYEWKRFPSKSDFMAEAEKMFEIAEQRRRDSEVFAVEWRKYVRQRAREEAKAAAEKDRLIREEKARRLAEKEAVKQAKADEKARKKAEREALKAQKQAEKEAAKLKRVAERKAKKEAKAKATAKNKTANDKLKSKELASKIKSIDT